MRTAVAFDWPVKDSTVTAGSCADSPSRKDRNSTIDRLLEGLHAKAAIGVEEAFAFLPLRQIEVGDFFDRVDDAVLRKAGARDLTDARVLRARSAQRKLEILNALTVHPQHA